MDKKIYFLLFLILFVVGCTSKTIQEKMADFGSYETASINAVEDVKNTEITYLDNGSVYQMTAEKIVKEINGKKFVMYGYNGETPGPLLKVKQGTTIKVNFTNNLDKETTIHWHGLRHNYKDDGVPNISQDPVKPGESFIYTLSFPDEGIFWYHPHVREDAQQDLGLYGNILVEPKDDKYNKVDREVFLIVDDILIENNTIVPYGKEHANYALMGRFGNVMLVNGQTNYTLDVEQGNTIRFYITDVSNVRPFNLSIGGASIKLIGSDIGRYEKETIVDSLIIGPAERYIIEVNFDNPGAYNIRNINMWESYNMSTIKVSPSNKTQIKNAIHEYGDVKLDIDKYKKYFDRPIDEEINLGIELNGAVQEMHSLEDIEWEDLMFEHNAIVGSNEILWYIENNKTKKQNMNLTFEFKTGDIKKIRFINSRDSKHPMQHMIHLHGQRFLVLEQDGIRNENLVWKDTFFIPTGNNITILLDASNPGIWMMHCHIAEHLESGMMTSFIVRN
jgi:FtsP/CotA-like multicopper oxidase with cupredoxin domain